MSVAKRAPKVRVGQDEPRTPKHSLPSYKEPTPETHRRLTREDEAEIALKRTIFTQWTPHLLIALFLLTIAAVPLIQLAIEFRRGDWRTLSAFKAVVRRGELLPRAEDLKAAEKTVETDSVVSQWLLPPAQSFLTGKLRAASEQVYLGRDGWLFYRADVEYVTAPGFLEAAQLRRRTHAAPIQPDPIKAIAHLRDQLAARGIDLIVLPVPTKATVQGEMLSDKVAPNEPLQNASFAEFQERVSAAGVRVFDPAPTLMSFKKTPLYLERDTHWRPETMELVAQELAAEINGGDKERRAPGGRGAEMGRPAERPSLEISGVGDLSRMLKLPNPQPQTVTIRQIVSGNSLWRPSREADVLLLGDSFSNIFSLEALGWGESAGFAEQLSYELRRPIDCILRNSDGAFATREMLAHELARGRDRLAGKKVVIWQFAARELAFGNWKLIDLKLGSAAAARFFTPPPGAEIEVSGMVEATSSVPRPGSVPYADHVMAVQLSDVKSRDASANGAQAVVYLMSMRENVWTPAARLRPGDRVTLRLRNWSEVSAQFEQINRSELDDPELQLEEPVWGELHPR